MDLIIIKNERNNYQIENVVVSERQHEGEREWGICKMPGISSED